MSEAEQNALRDVLWKMYQEHTVQGRHHETQRSAVASALVAIAGAVIGLVTFDKSLSLWDIPLTLLLIAIGIFGIVFSAKHYERFALHMERARTYRDALDELLPGGPLKKLKIKADNNSFVPYVTKIRLKWLWYYLNFIVLIIGCVLTFMAWVGVKADDEASKIPAPTPPSIVCNQVVKDPAPSRPWHARTRRPISQIQPSYVNRPETSCESSDCTPKGSCLP